MNTPTATLHLVRMAAHDPQVVDQAAEALCELLESMGFAYDEDYTTYYGGGWATVGVALLTVQAVRAARGLGYAVVEA